MERDRKGLEPSGREITMNTLTRTIERPTAREIVDRMERLFHERRGAGRFIEASQPQPDNEDLQGLIQEHPAFAPSGYARRFGRKPERP